MAHVRRDARRINWDGQRGVFVVVESYLRMLPLCFLAAHTQSLFKSVSSRVPQVSRDLAGPAEVDTSDSTSSDSAHSVLDGPLFAQAISTRVLPGRLAPLGRAGPRNRAVLSRPAPLFLRADHRLRFAPIN